MNKHLNLLLAFCLLGIALHTNAQDVYKNQRAGWLAKAQQNIPVLNETEKKPVSIVTLVKDAGAFQGWKAEKSAPVDSLYRVSFVKKKEVVLDFGEHLTGYFSFKLDTLLRTPDAPVKIKLTFGEVPAEVATPFDPYPGGLSRAWLQDEVVTVMDIPSVLNIQRRLAFRYVKIELLGASQYYQFRISDAVCKAVTSVKTTPAALSATAPALIADIDRIGLATLKECMQTVYEDGPKRDRRLWIGDLFLESLANSYSFKNHDLTKRCLYLLAGLSAQNGYLHGTVFEKPTPHPQAGQFLMDYAWLYNCALKEYTVATNDTQTANDLWPVAKKQLEIIQKYVTTTGVMDFEKANKEWWLFFDWKDGLHRAAALQGIAIYALKNTYELAKLLHKENEVSYIPALALKMTHAARRTFYNTQTGLFESGPDKQVSYASQVWMILAGVPNNKGLSKKALNAVMLNPAALKPGSPYLYHYFIQALIDADMKKEAKAKLQDYWGGMVKKGADTFWEVYDPANEYLSPYQFFPINSYCHAWSCTPVYFIRKYPQIFQEE